MTVPAWARDAARVATREAREAREAEAWGAELAQMVRDAKREAGWPTG